MSKSLKQLQSANINNKTYLIYFQVFSWLEKVSTNISLGRLTQQPKPKSGSVKEFPLKSPYIKFEPERRDARPVYKSLDTWPVLELEGPAGSCAFRMKPRQEENESEVKMTRRSRPRLSVRI